MQQLIDSVSHGVPAAFGELVTLGRTLKKRAADVLAYFNHPGTSNGPTEAINGRLEHLRSSALGFRNLTSPDPYSRPAGSGRNYTLDREEPIFLLLSTAPFMRAWYGMYLFPEESALWVGRPALGAHSTPIITPRYIVRCDAMALLNALFEGATVIDMTTNSEPPEAEASHAESDLVAERLAYSVDEAARLIGLSRDLLYDQMRCGNLPFVKVGRRRLITRQHLQQFLGVAPQR